MIKDLAYYGDTCLRKKCKGVEDFNSEVKNLAQNLIETLLEHDGAGLAAPQIGECTRMFVIRYKNGMDSEGRPLISSPKVYINPTLSNPSTQMMNHGEGCLSIPGIYEEVSRPFSINIEAMDINGEKFTEEVNGWRAKVIMHENDHINGVLFIDRIDPKSRKKIDENLKAIRKKYNSPHN